MTPHIQANNIICGDSREVLQLIEPNSIACSVWSPPYHVGKQYEVDMSFEEWQALLQDVICLHYGLLQPGGFMVINIADILCFNAQNNGRKYESASSGCHQRRYFRSVESTSRL